MKIKIFLLILFFKILLTENSYSQSKFIIGFKSGLIFNKNTISGENISSYSNGLNKAGLIVDLSLRFSILKYFSLLSEVDYLDKGMNYNLHKASLNSSNPRAHYLGFDILPVFKYINPVLTPYLFLGPHFEIIVNYDKVTQVDGGSLQLPNIYGNTLGFSAGAGIEKLIFKKISLDFVIKYTQDLTSAAEFSEMLGVINYYKNSSFNLLLGLNYTIGN